MKYSRLVEFYERLAATPSKLEKASIISELLKETEEKDLPDVTMLLMGRIFPPTIPKEIGVSTQLVTRSIASTTGFSEEEVGKRFKKHGDLGLVIEDLIGSRRQKSLMKGELTLGKVMEKLRSLAEFEGSSSQKKKIDAISELLNSSSPLEARYIARTILGELRVGVADGMIKDAIVKAYFEEQEGGPEAVEYAWNVLGDFGQVARIAATKGLKGVKSAKLKLGQPCMVMLGEKADSIEEVLPHYKCAIEPKFDGARIQGHKNGEKIWLFTRRLEDVTRQFPDVVELLRKALKPEKCVVEGEVISIDPKGRPLPFQSLSQRIQRKYDIEKMVKAIPVQMSIFDILFDGEMLFGKSFRERREILEKSVKEIKGKLQLAPQLVTEDVKKAEKFYQQVLDEGHEGVMIKNLDSHYVFGRHVDGWYKIKPTLETLDCVIIGATWGEGKRSKWLSSYVLGVRDENGEFVECGRMSTGLSEAEYDEMTKRIKPLVREEKGKDVWVEPRIVIAVGYQEIQKSPTYKSGYALRFPRLISFRDDKSPKEADNMERLVSIYKQQFGKKITAR